MKKHPPIPYVPVVDEVQDAHNKSKGRGSTYTIKLPDKTVFTENIWDAGIPKDCRQLSVPVRTAKTQSGKSKKGTDPRQSPADAEESAQICVLNLLLVIKWLNYRAQSCPKSCKTRPARPETRIGLVLPPRSCKTGKTLA